MKSVHPSRSSTFHAVLLLSSILFASMFALCQSAPDATKNTFTNSWNLTIGQQGLSGNANPTLSSQSHSESGGRILDKQSIQTLGPDGRYVPYLDVERESVKVDASTVRTVERTFGRDPDGRKTLQQVTEVEQRNLGDGHQKTVRTTSNLDANGGLQIVNRAIEESRQVSPKVRDTKTTVLTPDPNGGFTPAMVVEQRDTQGTGQNQFRKSTLLPDGNGGWQVNEVREGTVKQDGKDQIKEESVLRPNADGKLTVSERTVTKQQTKPGEERETTETYATGLPGTSEDGNLHLNQRITKVSRPRLDGGQVTEERVEQRNPGAPADTPRTTQQAIDIVRPGTTGTTTERTVQAVSADGMSGVMWVDTQKRSGTPAIQVQIAPAKPQ